MTQHASGLKTYFAVIAKITYVLNTITSSTTNLYIKITFPFEVSHPNSQKEIDTC